MATRRPSALEKLCDRKCRELQQRHRAWKKRGQRRLQELDRMLLVTKAPSERKRLMKERRTTEAFQEMGNRLVANFVALERQRKALNE